MDPILSTHAILHRRPNAGFCYVPDSETSTERVNRTWEEILDSRAAQDNSPLTSAPTATAGGAKLTWVVISWA